jgi:hypothetical protein
MHTIGGIVLGILNIGIVVCLLLLLGLCIQWLAKAFGYDLLPEMRKIWLLLVLLVAVYMLIALFLGLPTVRIVGQAAVLLV